MIQTREKEAISAYLKLLKSKGASTHVLYQRALFLEKFALNLQNKAATRTDYSLALDEFMHDAPAEERQENTHIAREFYPFWMQDFKAIASFSKNFGFNLESTQWKPNPASLNTLLDNLAKTDFNPTEQFCINAYKQALKDLNLNPEVMDSQLKLAKIILIRLRDAPALNHRSYRIAVDLILPLFNMEENKTYFLFVVREFYPYWIAEQID